MCVCNRGGSDQTLVSIYEMLHTIHVIGSKLSDEFASGRNLFKLSKILNG